MKGKLYPVKDLNGAVVAHKTITGAWWIENLPGIAVRLKGSQNILVIGLSEALNYIDTEI